MTSAVRPPLTIIPPTPRKEMETKYIFNPVSGQVNILSHNNLYSRIFTITCKCCFKIYFELDVRYFRGYYRNCFYFILLKIIGSARFTKNVRNNWYRLNISN